MVQLNKSYFIFTYLLIPLVFFGIPIVLKILDIDFKFHYYVTITPTLNELLTILLGYLIIGIFINYIIDLSAFNLQKYSKTYHNIIIVLSFMFWIFSFSYLKMIAFPIFIYLVANYKLKTPLKVVLVLISFFAIILLSERYSFVVIMLLVFKDNILKSRILKLAILSIFAISLLVFVLEPLKVGTLVSQYEYDITGIIIHLQPLYISNFVAYRFDNSIPSLLIESLPLFKSLFSSISVVDKIGYEVLPSWAYSSGSRLGSSSSMFFSVNGIVALVILLTPITVALKEINSFKVRNSILMYLFLMSPYFVRRSISSFIVDIILLILISSGIVLFSSIKTKKS